MRKIVTTNYLILLLGLGLVPLANAQYLPANAKPKAAFPVLAKEHAGPGRVGVKLAIIKDNGFARVVGLVPRGPASDFGLRLGDVILKIDKNYTNTLTEDEIHLALHGTPKTGVELTIQRGDDPKLIVVAVERRVLPPGSEDVPDSVRNTVIPELN